MSTPEKTRTSFVAAERERRLAKLEALRERGIEPYPERSGRDGTIAGPFDRVQKAFAKALDPFFQISSLRTFNAKFEPHCLGRAIAVEDTGYLAKVGVLCAAAEGFLDVPLIGRLLTPKPA